MAYITDAAREYAKKMRDEIDFPEVEEDDWLILGPGQDASAFVTFSKEDEAYIKRILKKYASMIAHVEGNVYLALDGPNNKIKSTEGINQLIKENVLHRLPKELGEKYVNKLNKIYDEDDETIEDTAKDALIITKDDRHAYEMYIDAVKEYNENVKKANEILNKLYDYTKTEKKCGIYDKFSNTINYDIGDQVQDGGTIHDMPTISFAEFVKRRHY